MTTATVRATATRMMAFTIGPWTVLTAASAILLLTMGWRYSFGVFFKAMAAELGWDRGTLSLVVALNMVAFGASQPTVGRLVDRFGPRRVLAVGSVILGLGLTSVSVSESFVGVGVTYGLLVGLGFGATTITPNTALVIGWFDRNRGLALGIAAAAISGGQVLMVPLATAVLTAYGWRQGFLVLGTATTVLLLLVIVAIVRDQPARGPEAASGRTAAAAAPAPRPLEAMRTRAFWQLGGAFLTCGFAITLMSTHFIPYATDVGLTTAAASRLFALVGVMSIVGSVTTGWLSDRIGRRLPLAGVYLLRVFGFLALSRARTAREFMVCVIVLGFAWAAPFPLTSAFTGDLWGKRAIATIFGTVLLFHLVGDALGAYVGGLLFDRTGSYVLVFTLAAGLAGMAGVSILLMPRRRPPAERAGV